MAGAACSVHGGRRLGRSAPVSRSRPRRARRDKTQGTTCPNHVIDGSHRRSPATASPPLPSPWPLRARPGRRQARRSRCSSRAPHLLLPAANAGEQDTTGQDIRAAYRRPSRPDTMPAWLVAGLRCSLELDTEHMDAMRIIWTCIFVFTGFGYSPTQIQIGRNSMSWRTNICEQCPSVFHFVESLWVYLDGEGRDDVS